MNDNDEGAVWFVTGASSGLGRSIVLAALRSGAVVVATARRTTALDDVVALWPDTLLVLPLDVTDSDSLPGAVDAALERFGRIDVLVNNAGRAQIGGMEETSDVELRALFDLHVFAPMSLVRAVLPSMRSRRRGLIVQMSSMGSVLVKPGFGAYSGTKAALDALSAALDAEVAPFGIDVMIVQPGSHRTSVFAPESRYMVDPMPEYADVLGDVRDFVDEADGDQPGDPDLAGEVIVRLASADERPLRLALGADAVRLIDGALQQMSDELTRWTSVSLTTSRSDAPSAERIAARHDGTRAK